MLKRQTTNVNDPLPHVGQKCTFILRGQINQKKGFTIKKGGLILQTCSKKERSLGGQKHEEFFFFFRKRKKKPSI